ncbi:MAG: hypothetical protein ACTS78_02535 [Arsenophonus sp. NC-WZS1-MAG3]
MVSILKIPNATKTLMISPIKMVDEYHINLSGAKKPEAITLQDNTLCNNVLISSTPEI